MHSPWQMGGASTDAATRWALSARAVHRTLRVARTVADLGRITLNSTVLSATGVTTPPGTLLNGYGSIIFGGGSGACTVDFAGTNDLTGSGVLCYVSFNTVGSGGSPGERPHGPVQRDPKVTNGSVTVSALPTITVNPDNLTLLAGQTQQFTVSGSPTLPITWSTLDPAVASISGTGLLTALAGGVTKVRAVDSVGALDENTAVTVYDFAASLGTTTAPPGASVLLYLSSDRALGALNIRSLQYKLTYNSTWITQAQARPAGLVGAWGGSAIVNNSTPGQLLVAEAGSNPLPGGSNAVQAIESQLSPAVPSGTNLPITLSNLLCNEGRPSAQIASGSIQVSNAVDATGALPTALRSGRRLRTRLRRAVIFTSPFPEAALRASRSRSPSTTPTAGECARWRTDRSDPGSKA